MRSNETDTCKDSTRTYLIRKSSLVVIVNRLDGYIGSTIAEDLFQRPTDLIRGVVCDDLDHQCVGETTTSVATIEAFLAQGRPAISRVADRATDKIQCRADASKYRGIILISAPNWPK